MAAPAFPPLAGFPHPRSKSEWAGAKQKKRQQARRARLDRARQAGRHDLDPRRVGDQAFVYRKARRPCRYARSAGLRLSAGRARRGDQDRAVRGRQPQGLRFHHLLGRGARHRRCRRPRDGTSEVRPDAAAIRALLPRFTGTIEQVPPRFSAIKIAGERAYDLAREGETVEIAPRAVTVHRLDLAETPGPGHAVLTAECGKGTYVRALARDLGRMLGTFGHVCALRRSRVGPFGEREMISLERLKSLCHRAAVWRGPPRRHTPADRDRAGRHPGAGREPGTRRGSTGAKPSCCADGMRPVFRGMVQVPLTGRSVVAIAEVDRGEIIPRRVFDLAGITGRAGGRREVLSRCHDHRGAKRKSSSRMAPSPATRALPRNRLPCSPSGSTT